MRDQKLAKIHCPKLEVKKSAVSRSVFDAKLDGTISGYASVFDTVDLGLDCMRPGAFARSLKQRPIKNIRMLFQHDPDKPVGVWDEVREDERGLFVKGRLNKETKLGAEVLSLVRQGALDGLSIGFKTIKATRKNVSGVRDLLEVDLWEISIVTFPMLPQACIEEVKGKSCSHRSLPSPRTLEHWLMRDAGLSRRNAQTLLSKGYGALQSHGVRDAACGSQSLAQTISRATELLQNR